MSNIKTSVMPNGMTLQFEEKWHKYSVKEKPELKFISGTKFLSKFSVPFDRDGISARYAKKYDMKQKDVINMWEKKGEISREAGTLVHNYIEDVLLGKEPRIPQTVDSLYSNEIIESGMKKIKQADLVCEKILDEYEIVAVEEILASIEYGIAGMADLRAINKKSRAMTILDHKTNAKIDMNNRWSNMLPPIQNLEDCSFNKYSLQLNLYEKVLKLGDYVEPDEYFEHFLIHIKEDSFSFVECDKFEKEIGRMLVDWSGC